MVQLAKLGLLAGAALFGSEALAQNDAVDFGPSPEWAVTSELLPVPEDASGLVFIRRQDVLVHLDARGQASYQNQTVRILHPQALQAGNIAIAWNPAVGAPVVHALRVHRDGAIVDVLESARFEVLRREDQLEQAMLEGVLTAVLRVPDLRVGDDLEFAYTVRTEDPTLGPQNAGALMMIGTMPPGRFLLGLSWDNGQEPTIRPTPDLADLGRREGRSWQVRIDNPPILTMPKDAPPRFAWQRVVEYSDFASWSEVSRRFEPLYANAATLPANSPVKAEVARIAATHPDKLGRAQAALKLVQQQVRYIYVGLDGGNLAPASADETWRRRYGDCKGKTALLLALLADLGVEAQAVVVNNSGGDDGLDQRLPNPGLFDHVLVRARIEGKTYWLDGTLPQVAHASTAPLLPYRWVLPLTSAGSGLEAIPFQPASLPDEMGIYEIDARAGFDQPGRITHASVKRGIRGLTEYMQFSALTRDQLLTTFRGALDGSSQWDTIDAVDYRYDSTTQASILTIKGTGPIDWDEQGDGRYNLALPGGGFSPPPRRQRAADQDQNAPFYSEPSYSCHATTVRFPEDTAIENWGFNSVFDTKLYGRLYYRMMERRDDGTLRMVRGSRVDEPEVSAETARRDNERLSRFDNSRANVTYDPNRTMEPWGKLSSVPATYEIDWTGPQAPCLPADVLK